MESRPIQYYYSCQKCGAYGYTISKVDKCPECGNSTTLDVKERVVVR